MDFKLPHEIKKRILNDILTLQNPFNLSDEYTLPDFLSEFLDLRNIESSSFQFKTAYEEAIQHTVNNDDWDYNYIFGERFNILSNDKVFKAFLEKTILKSDITNRNLLISFIQNRIKSSNYRMVQSYDVNSNIIYSIEEVDNSFNQVDIPINNIPFYVVDRSFIPNSKKRPFFTLQADNWEDFGFKTTFFLEFFSSEGKSYDIGVIKIMKKEEFDTILDKNFFKLDNEY